MNLPIGTSPNDKNAPWNPPEMSEWAGVETGACCCCEEFGPLDEEYTCESCFVPVEIEEEPEDEDFYWED